MMTTEIQRTTMIDGQILPNKVSDPAVISALRSVAREAFMPKALRAVAYVDEDLEVAPGRFIMEPMVFARLVDMAQIKSDDLILDIGPTFGYSTAVLAQLSSTVVGLENNAEMATKANDNLLKADVSNAAVVEAALCEGYAKEAPFDVIFLNGCVEEIPQALIDQMAEGGRIVGVRIHGGLGRGFIGEKHGGVFGVKDFMDANVPMLPGFKKTKTFQF